MKAIIVAADRAASYCYRMKVRQHLSYMGRVPTKMALSGNK
jgi:hypothetical protein